MAKALVAPMGVAVGGGYVYVGERGANRVRRIRLSDGQGAAERRRRPARFRLREPHARSVRARR